MNLYSINIRKKVAPVKKFKEMKWVPLLFLLVTSSNTSKSTESSRSGGSDDESSMELMEVEDSSLGDELPDDPFIMVPQRQRIDLTFTNTDTLIVALSLGDPGMVDKCLNDPETDISAGNNSALYFAFKYCSAPLILKVLTRVDASANEDALLKMACSEDDFQAVSLLLCDPRVDPSRNDFQALIEAAGHGHVDILNLLLSDSRVSMENPFVQVAIKLAISGFEIDDLGTILSLSFMRQFKKTLKLPCDVSLDRKTILAVGQLAINHGLAEVIDQIQWLLVSLDILERINVFQGLLMYCSSRTLDAVLLNLLGQAHALGDLCFDLFDVSLLQACRFSHIRTVDSILNFAKLQSYTLLPLVDSTLLYCRRYGQYVIARHLIEVHFELTLSTPSQLIETRLVELAGSPSCIFYAETLLKLRLAIEWAEHSNNAQFPLELVEYLFFLSLTH